ncbi:PIR Superfamily Protein [Plasmodium ovale curtisi]|uniref:PIR Superfamily Protein n=2 Tax=Plasmodium ovale curtisi TaxID=864141 RepID=A0A1A8WDW9_PLAOA|nr:PIR Superfamily Protein [Plasmodium ovale curtisi]
MSGGNILNNPKYYQIFFRIRETFPTSKNAEYDEFLHKTDQTLRNIGMYLIENYKGDYSYCSSEKDCPERCKYLNAWLNEKKSIYTSNGNCDYYNKLWQDNIEKLWNKLDESMKGEEKCGRDKSLSGKTFPNDQFSIFCNMNDSYILSLTFPDKTYAKSCTTMLTMTYVVVGIIFLYMYFFKFSNLGNKIKNLIINKIGVRNHTDEHDNEELLRTSQNDTMSSINRMYNLSYNSPKN